ncbi:hypothetical protein L218DRAFT_876971 [Marasmius fiardii PR-910]|nr:hypothetical protein L218DRAFT_876971 [Marasmius fiardii PR-910]
MVFNPFDTVTAQMTYVVPPPDGGQTYQLVDVKSGKLIDENVLQTVHDVVVENIRGKERLYTLDSAGFQYFYRPSRHPDLNDTKELEEYGRESTEIVKEITGASRVILYESAQRRRPTGEKDRAIKKRKPAGQVHVDVSAAAAVDCLHSYAPSEYLLDLPRRHRWQIINLWRPIGVAAYDSPLAFCIWNSVNPETDTFPVPRLHPKSDDSEETVKYNEALGVSYSRNHQWKYVRGMTPDDFVLIKNYDSDDSVARFTPHAAFADSTTSKNSPPRESIELRFLVLYD